jgi:predicted DNA-binding WGR domain protein
LIALRIAHSIREKIRRETGKGDNAISVETKTFTQRKADLETVYQVTLDERKLKVRWGKSGEAMRVQQFRFPSVDDARDDYLKRVDALLEKGFLDAS